MTIWQIAAVGILIGVITATLKEGGGKLVPFVVSLGGVMLLLWGVSRLGETFSVLETLGEGVASPYLEVVFKGLSVGYVVRVGGDVMRDLGSDRTAEKLELCGKLELVAISLPLVLELVEVAISLVEGG